MSEAVFVQNDGSVGILATTACGILTGEQVSGLGTLVKSLNLPALKITTRQTIIVLCTKEQVEEVKSGLEHLGFTIGSYDGVVRNVKGCCGAPNLCQRYLADALGLGIKLQNLYLNSPVPKDFKMSTSGCFRGCTDPYCADFGVVGSGKDLFNVYLGGRGGSSNPLHGTLIAERITEENVLSLISHVLKVYRENGQPHERIWRTIERIGIAEFKLEFKPNSDLDPGFLAFLGGGLRG